MMEHIYFIRIIRIIIFFLIIGSLLSCNTVTNSRKIKIGHGLDQSHPVHKAMLYLADVVEKKSRGKIQITVYPSQ